MIQKNLSKQSSLIILHIIIFIWGFTGILGELIEMSSLGLVFNRMLIAYLFLALIVKQNFVSLKNKKKFFLTGLIIAIHWICFFEAIKIYNVSLAVTCLSTTALFTSIIDPIINKVKIKKHELFLSFFVIIGIIIIYTSPDLKSNNDNLNSFKNQAILLSIISAFCASIFTSLNSIFIKNGNSSYTITKYEMLGGSIFCFIYMILKDDLNIYIIPSYNDLPYILVLSIICTAFAYLVSVEIMKKIKPFTMNISVNLEPIYAIILALIIFPQNEKMSFLFYLGGFIILISIIINSILKKHYKKKKSRNY